MPQSKKYSVKITIDNRVPDLLSNEFEEVMRKACVKELKRKGFYELPIDSPQFHFTLVLKVDSFNAGIRESKPNAVYTPAPSKEYYTFKHTVKAIMFDCVLRNYKQGWKQWEIGDDLYYFGETRDIGRSEGMVRYLIRSAPRI